MLTLNFLLFPILETTRLKSSEITFHDAEAIYQLRTNAEVMKYLDRPMAASIDEITPLITQIGKMTQAGEGISWAITLKGDDRLIGTIGYWQITAQHYRAEIGYTLHPGHQGRGIMPEAMETVLNYGFDVMKLHSVEGNVKPGNEASKKLLLKHGFVQEAYFKENYYYDGKFLDSAIYSLLSHNKSSFI